MVQRQGDSDADYERLHDHVRRADVRGVLFTTDATRLFDIYLQNLPVDRRQYYNCRCCMRFVDTYGGLVRIDEYGSISSPFWQWSASGIFSEAVREMSLEVGNSRVTGVFLSSSKCWGVPVSLVPAAPGGVWSHLHSSPPTVYDSLFAEQVMAEKREDYGMLQRGLADYPVEVVQAAYEILSTGHLYRSEKCLGVAKWLLDLHRKLAGVPRGSFVRENLVWRAVADAPPGYCHVRTSVISTLLDDLAAGKTFEETKRAFDAKMDPLRYQRPQAAPRAGQVAAAEALVEKLRSAGSLSRRFARMEDIRHQATWLPRKVEEPGRLRDTTGVFAHLRPETKGKKVRHVDASPVVMTWEKFRTTVLPSADRIEWRSSAWPYSRNHPFFAFVTCAVDFSPPILQWDSDARRNPVSWYMYHGQSNPEQWNLNRKEWNPVTGIFLQPSSWDRETSHSHHGNGAYFLLEGARDKRSDGAGLGLFPEILRSEYRGIRSAIEAYSKSKSLPPEPNPACGVALQTSNKSWEEVFRVTRGGVSQLYKLDRWD